MKKYATKSGNEGFWVWIIWAVVAVSLWTGQGDGLNVKPVLGIATLDEKSRKTLFPWEGHGRCKKQAYEKYKEAKTKYYQEKRRVACAKIALSGMETMAEIVDSLTASQVRHKLGALPVLYSLLETLEVQKIINRHCKQGKRTEIDHGTVALVLVLNRLMLPLPLSQLSDWVGQTMLVAVLEIEASKFNDDRLGRTLDALYEHLDKIWLEIIDVAVFKANIDLSVIFYDISAFVGHGSYKESKLMSFGFAHNTPSNKRKLKIGLNASADGNIPLLHRLWSGRTADQATVEQNMNNLAKWLTKHGKPLNESMVVGDRAMLNAELAIMYEQKGLRHLTGLKASTNELKEQVSYWNDEQVQACPIVDGDDPQYWGRGCQIKLAHEQQSVTLKGLVVVAGPMRDQHRQDRQQKIAQLYTALSELRTRLNQGKLTTVKSVLRSVNARLNKSGVSKFILFDVSQTPDGLVHLHWWINEQTLSQAERFDGRYLLVTNDSSLSHKEMFRLYRQKDGVETCFHICKSDLSVSPLFLHKDKRISSMIFINMVALLAYNLLQRQLQQQGLSLTSRQLIKRLETLVVIETICHDGSRLQRLAEVDPDTLALLDFCSLALRSMVAQTIPASPQPTPQLTCSDSSPQLC